MAPQTIPFPREPDAAVLEAWKRVEVQGTPDEAAAPDWGDADASVLNAIVGLGVAATRAELPDLAWPDRVELSVLFGSDREVAELNARFRAKPKPTNVLSFPSEALARGDAPPAYLGDLAFAGGVVRHEAAERGVDLSTHLATLAVHGTLHLLGHDHEPSEGDAEAMERLEARILARLGLPDPYEGTEPA